MFYVLGQLFKLYALVLLVNMLLPYFLKTQKPWTAVLAKICEPALSVGRAAAAKILPNRTFSFDIGSVAAIVLCLVIGLILGWL